MRSVVGGKDDHRVVINSQILERLNQIPHHIIHAPDHGGVAFLRLVGGSVIDSLIVRMDVGILGEGSFHPGRCRPLRRSRVGGFIPVLIPGHPLQASLEARFGGIGARGHRQGTVRSGEGQVQEEGLGGRFGMVVHDPLLGARAEQVRVISRIRNLVRHIGEGGGRGAVIVFVNVLGFRDVVVVPRQVLHNPVKVIESAFVGAGIQAGRPLSVAADAPFADSRRMVPGAFQHRGQRVGVFYGIIKAVVADNAGMALVHPQQQGGAGRSANGRRAVMAPQLHPFRRHGIQLRRLEAVAPRHRSSVLVLMVPVFFQVAPAHVIHQHEDDIGPGPGNMPRHGRLFRHIRLKRQQFGRLIIIP